MKILVDEMPCNSNCCPFFEKGTCKLDFEKCGYLDRLNWRNDVWYHEDGTCPYLKPIEEVKG